MKITENSKAILRIVGKFSRRLRAVALVAVMGLSMAACGDGKEEKEAAAERWWSWNDPDSEAKITYSVDGDGVCTINISGTPEQNANDAYKAQAGYDYTGEAGKFYKYTFEAWTTSGSRNLRLMYFQDNVDQVYLFRIIPITATRTTYTVYGQDLPKSGLPIIFHCADQTGTIKIKILEITENTTGKLTITNFSSRGLVVGDDVGGYGWSSSVCNLFFCAQPIPKPGTNNWDAFSITIRGDTVTIPVWELNDEAKTYKPFTGTVTIDIKGDGNADAGLWHWSFANDKTTNYKSTKSITFTNGNATIDFSDVMVMKAEETP